MSRAVRVPGERGRRAARRQAVFLLYQRDVTGLEIDELVANSERAGDPLDPFAQALVDGVSVDASHLDGLIASASEDWTPDRIAPLERNILRVAVHEMLDWPEIPIAVSINEAVDLAKRFCQAQAGSLVNGILGRIEREGIGAEQET